jgi:hypothetical protein
MRIAARGGQATREFGIYLVAFRAVPRPRFFGSVGVTREIDNRGASLQHRLEVEFGGQVGYFDLLAAPSLKRPSNDNPCF